ncbi:hypothetical protein [Nocardioides sp. AN3]
MHGFWPPVTRYVQADVFDEGLEGFPDVTTGVDAIGESLYADRAACDEAIAARLNDVEGTAVAVRDAGEFLTWEPYVGIFGGEYTHLGGRDRAPLRLFACFARDSSAEYARFAEVILGAVEVVGAGTALTLGRAEDFPATAAGKGNEPFEAVLSVWFASEAAVRSFLAGEWWRGFTDRTRMVVDPGRSLLLVSREGLVVDRPGELAPVGA